MQAHFSHSCPFPPARHAAAFFFYKRKHAIFGSRWSGSVTNISLSSRATIRQRVSQRRVWWFTVCVCCIKHVEYILPACRLLQEDDKTHLTFVISRGGHCVQSIQVLLRVYLPFEFTHNVHRVPPETEACLLSYRDVNMLSSYSVALSSAACSCHPVGSVLSGGRPLCNPSSGECTCKPGVGGPRCDGCMLGYWGLHEYGCRPCDCTGDCDPYTGDCLSGWEPRLITMSICARTWMKWCMV